MRVLFLFNYSRRKEAADIEAGIGHDNHFNGMYRIRKFGIKADFLEPEHFVSQKNALRWRQVFGMHWMTLPFFPLFLRYDIVFTGTAYGSMLLRALLGIRRPKWVIYDANIAGEIGTATSWRQKLFRFAVNRADGIVTLSQAEADTLRTMFGHSRVHDGIVFLHEGVDTNYFKPMGMDEDSYILSVGLDNGRDFKTLIEAVRDLPIELKIATKPERLKNISLPPNVSVKYYGHDEIRELYARARVIVIPLNMKTDNNDSMGTFVVIEAMASGKAIIVTRTKALASYIEDGKNGVFVPVRDIEAMRVAILDLWSDADKRSRLGAEARTFALECADADLYAQKLADYFKKLVSND